MDRRREPRVFVDLPVQIWGMDANSYPFSQPASVRSISGSGATLQCVDARLTPGEMIDVLYDGTRGQFRIVWCGKPGTQTEGEVGLENVSNTQMWDVDPLRCAATVGQG
jgi:hypothetical protein